ncbi:MAG: hypothetical protein H5T64_13410 [Chloroflexi bacterium]|nr:hypothetical protein [Chloroflexota bacterium]
MKAQVETLWVVVKVESGIPVMAEVYQNEQSAKEREQCLRTFMHPENDETGVFRVQVQDAATSDNMT